MKKVTKSILLFVFPLLIASAFSIFFESALNGWVAFYSVVYMPIVASLIGAAFFLAVGVWRKVRKTQNPTGLQSFLYGFYFGCSSICTLILIMTKS